MARGLGKTLGRSGEDQAEKEKDFFYDLNFLLFHPPRYEGEAQGLKQMGLTVKGVSLFDHGNWTLRIKYGPVFAETTFEVLLHECSYHATGSLQIVVQSNSEVTTTEYPPQFDLTTNSELPIRVQVNFRICPYPLLFT